MIQVRRLELNIPHQSSGIVYPILIGTHLLAHLQEIVPLENFSRVLFLIDRNLEEAVTPLLSPLVDTRCSLHLVECGEKCKDFSHLQELLEVFHRYHLDRRSLVINIGGGMLGDFGGFAASIYMRGIKFIQVPTTLLAQVDASVGGKVAINFSGIKNLIGAFQQPEMVLIDTAVLETLPRRELLSGFSEIIKHAIIRDADFFVRLEATTPDELMTSGLAEVIEHSCAIKAGVVQQDPHEAGLRRILNFGHTIGHAIETLAAEGNAPLLHGECVALGMVAEAALAHAKGMLQADTVTKIIELLRRYHLPVHLVQQFPAEALIERMMSDKKNSSGTILMALPDALGSCQEKVAVSKDEIALSLQTVYQ